MNPAAKEFDIVMGVDIHIVQPPPPAPPLPIPHPFIGIVFDPMDFIPILGATILVNGVPRAQAGSAAKDIPVHIPLGGVFVKPPANEGEMFMGSATVLADGEPFTHMGHPVLSCHDIGMIAPPRMHKEDGSKSMMLPTSVVLPIPMGKQVLIGGPPTISMMAIGMKLGFAALGKGMAKLNKFKKGSKRMEALAEKLRAAINKTGLSQKWKDRLNKLVCTITGHPVNVADGSVLTSITDFEFTGPIPFRWERNWFSNGLYYGPLGQGWYHNYDMALEIQSDNMAVARLAEGRLVAFPIPEAGNSYFHRREKITLINDGTSIYLRDNNLLTYRFKKDGVKNGDFTIYYLERIEDPNNFNIQFEYSRGNSLSRVLDSVGREFLFTTDDKGRIIKIEAPDPGNSDERFVLQSYAYDEIGNLVEARDALNLPFRYEYLRHLLSCETNRNGLSFYFEYDGIDELAKCHHTWGDNGIYNHKLKYFDGYTIVENSLGYQTTYFHEGGLVRKTIDPNGGVSITKYNEFNELILDRNPLGFGTTYAYDESGNRILTLDPNGASTKLEYNNQNLPVKATDSLGGIWAWQYDAKGNLLQKIDPLGCITQYAYNGGLLSEIINPAGGKTLLVYGQQLNLKMLITPDGQASWWSYDALGRCLETTDPKGNAQVRKYNLKGQLTEVREPDGKVRRLRYDGEGNVIRAKDSQYDVRFEYTGMDRMKARVEAGTRVEFQYDTEEQLTGIVNEHGSAYHFDLDANGDVIEEVGFDGIRRVYRRDAAGGVKEVQRPGGKLSKYDQDPCGRILKISHSDGTEEIFAYREDGELIVATNSNSTVQITRDLLGRVIQERQYDISVDSEYDKLGMRTSVRSSLGADFSFRRNNMGDVEGIESGDFSIKFQRDSLGLELEREFSGGLRSRWNRDKLGRPVKQETFTEGGIMQRTRTYQWDLNDRLRQIADSKQGLTRFGHDVFGNLAWSENPDGSTLFRMHDAVGNLFRTKERSDRKYGPGGQLLESGSTKYQYDLEGNLIRKIDEGGNEWRYGWNAAGMMSIVIRPDGEEIIFKYDAFGRRHSKFSKKQVTRWVWDGNTLLHEWAEEKGLPLEIRQSSLRASCEMDSSITSDLITWLFDPESFAPLAKIRNGKQYGFITDHLGTPLSMHNLFGETIWSADLNNYGEVFNLHGKAEECLFRNPGQYEDTETGLYYNRFRYYDAKEGMYLSQDPIRLKGGMRLYAYVKDPLSSCDPFGLATCTHGTTNKGNLQHFSGTDKPHTKGATPNSVYTRIDPKTGKATQNAIYDANGAVVGHVDFKNHGVDPNTGVAATSGHWHSFPPGDPSSGHGINAKHNPHSSTPDGWNELPPGVSPSIPIGK
jgi:RHS repeat-associated protein